MDKPKINLTISAASQAVDRLERALEQNNQRAVGAELYNIRRELNTIKILINPDRAKPKERFQILEEAPDLSAETLRALDDDWSQ